MFKSRTLLALAVVSVFGAMLAAGVFAQDAGGAGDTGGGRGGRGAAGGAGGAGGRFDPAAIQQRQLDQYKELLEAKDEDWQVLKPRIEKLLTAQREARSTMFGGRGRRGGPAGGEAAAEQTDLQKKTADLRAALENKDTKPEVIKEKLTAYREAREKAQQALGKAQQELRELLSVRQEAQCVLRGLLD